jgi:hypothetical protein
MKHPEAKRSLGPGRSPKVQRRYEHMMREDFDTWTTFLQSKEMILNEVWYDVHVGRVMEVPEGLPEYMHVQALAISRKRIDVVGRTENELWIIEVKPYANMQAIGQVLIYEDLFCREFELKLPTRTVIVASASDMDIIEGAAKYGVKIITVEGVPI